MLNLVIAGQVSPQVNEDKRRLLTSQRGLNKLTMNFRGTVKQFTTVPKEKGLLNSREHCRRCANTVSTHPYYHVRNGEAEVVRPQTSFILYVVLHPPPPSLSALLIVASHPL